MPADQPISLWDQTAEEADHAAPLDAGGVVDLAIVGGGFTGLSTALHAAERGLSAHVLEARRIGHGGSGRNVGLVNAGVWHPPDAVAAHLGPVYGPRFVERFGAAPQYVFDLIERHQIRCEVTKSGTIHAAHAPSGMRNLAARHGEWQRLGAPVELLDRAQVAQLTGTQAFHGGLLDHRAGTINPMGYCRGLARAARGAGAAISTGVHVTALRRDGTGWLVETGRGNLRAASVVLGTNAYTDELWPDLRRVFAKINFFQFATRPLGEAAAHILPGRQGVWDTGPIMTSLRRDRDGRLLIGSMGRVSGDATAGLSRRWAARHLKRLFPDLGPVEFEDAWHGRIAMTPDHLPRIYELDQGLFTPIAYNGRGITTGTIFGRAMADLLTGTDRADLPLPITRLSTVPAAPLREAAYQMAFTANQVLKSI